MSANDASNMSPLHTTYIIHAGRGVAPTADDSVQLNLVKSISLFSFEQS